MKTAARRRGQQVLTTRLEAGERWLQVHRHTRPAVLGVRASATMVLGMALRRGQVVKGKGAACGLCERAVRGVTVWLLRVGVNWYYGTVTDLT